MKEDSTVDPNSSLHLNGAFWHAGTLYNRGEIVYVASSNSFWVCLLPSVNSWPAEGDCWVRLDETSYSNLGNSSQLKEQRGAS
jgi:hypothetical protein